VNLEAAQSTNALTKRSEERKLLRIEKRQRRLDDWIAPRFPANILEGFGAP
jgi:hypothetical protein